MHDSSFIADPSTIVADLRPLDAIGVDTEFVREKTYYAQLCLVQLASPGEVWCVDPLVEEDMAGFWEEACSHTWVVHSARQDLEVVYQSSGRMPASLFDTQIAAALLGMAPQLGYAGLVSELFFVELPKSHTRADWSQRPLPEALLQYAVEDVEYLLPAYEELAARLDARGRLEWARQDSALLLQPSLYTIDAAQAAERLKGARNLRGPARGAAARLAAWRESEAIRRNRPRQWILRDSALLAVATARPGSMQELRRIDGLPDKFVQRAGRELLDAVAGRGGDVDLPPAMPAPDEQQKALLRELQAAVVDCAQDLGVNAEILASRKELSAVILYGRTDSRVFTDWRREIIGDRLLAML